MNYPSKLIEEAINEISRLPGIGKKSAFRLALHLLKKEPEAASNLAKAITNMRNGVRYCLQCHNVSDHEKCAICSSTARDKSLLCVVEDIQDVMAIENTAQYNGLYHVLGGIISPMTGVGPSDLHIDSLLQRVAQNDIAEVIFALSPTMEGDTTAFYLSKKLKESGVKISTIARGIPIGGELEYADEITLGRSIQTRISYQ